MALMIKRSVTLNAAGAEDVDNEASYELAEVPEGTRFIPLDGGATFVAVAVWALGQLIQGIGKGLGEELGKTLFGGRAAKDDIRELLDQFTRFVLQALKQEFFAERWRAAHEELATLSVLFNEMLIDKKRQTEDNLLAFDREIYASYTKLQGLGDGAFASQLRIGMVVISSALLWSMKSKSKDSRTVVIQRIESVMKDLDGTLTRIATFTHSRVVGPNEAQAEDVCYEPDPGPSSIAFPITPLRGGRGGGHWYRSSTHIYTVIVDGSVHSWRRFAPCQKKPDLSASAYAAALDFSNQTRNKINEEFEVEYLAPFRVAQDKAEELKKKLRS